MNKTKIIKIKFSKEQQEEIDKINKGERVPTVKTVINKKTGVKRDIVYNRHFTFESGVKRLENSTAVSALGAVLIGPLT